MEILYGMQFPPIWVEILARKELSLMYICPRSIIYSTLTQMLHKQIFLLCFIILLPLWVGCLNNQFMVLRV